MIDGAPEVNHLAIQLHVHFVEMPTPVAEALHMGNPAPANVAREHRAEPVPPHSHRLMTQMDAVLEKQIFHVS